MKMNEFKEPVRIRLKNLKSGCKSIYLDFYMKGRKREYKFLNLYLHPELSKEDKEWNKQQLQLANAIKSRCIIQIQNREYGFHDSEQSSKSNFIEYCRHLIGIVEDINIDILFVIEYTWGYREAKVTVTFPKNVE